MFINYVGGRRGGFNGPSARTHHFYADTDQLRDFHDKTGQEPKRKNKKAKNEEQDNSKSDELLSLDQD